MEKRQYLAILLALGTYLLWMAYTDINTVLPIPNLTETLMEIPPTGVEITLYTAIAGTVLEKILFFIYLFVYVLSIAFAVLYVTFREEKLIPELAMGLVLVMLITIVINSTFYVNAPHNVFGLNPLEGTFQRRFVNDRMLLPSLHVGISTILALMLARSKNKAIKWFYIFLAPCIWFSVVALLQHWFYDVVSGVIVAVVAAYIAERMGRNAFEKMERIDEKHLRVLLYIALVLSLLYTGARFL